LGLFSGQSSEARPSVLKTVQGGDIVTVQRMSRAPVATRKPAVVRTLMGLRIGSGVVLLEWNSWTVGLRDQESGMHLVRLSLRSDPTTV